MQECFCDRDQWFSIPGYLFPEEGRLLQVLSWGKAVLEVGCFLGKSTVAMAPHAQNLICVDPWTGSLDGDPGDDTQGELWYNTFLQNIKPWVHKIMVIRAHSWQVAFHMRRPLDLIYIDGDHRFNAVVLDVKTFKPYLAPGGVMVFHDRDMGQVIAGAVNAWGRAPDFSVGRMAIYHNITE